MSSPVQTLPVSVEIPTIPAAPPPQQIILQAGLAYIVSACLQVAVKLGIPDLLGTGGKSVRTLAAESGVDAGYLFRVLRVLETSGLFHRSGDTFSLTAAGDLLRSGVPGSMGAAAEWLTDPFHLKLYSELTGSVQAGTTTFDRIYGQPFFPWLSLAENAEEATVFNNAMTSISEMCVPAFLAAYDFTPFRKVVDVGGGHGALLRSILKANPGLTGVVADMPVVIEDTHAHIAGDGLAHCCTAVPCDFFASVPGGADCYIMKHIIHDWADEQALLILRNIREVIAADGRLILAEAVICAGPEPHPGKLLDIEMMVLVGGKERTEEEFRQLLFEAGFRLNRVVPTQSPLSLLEAVPSSAAEWAEVVLE